MKNPNTITHWRPNSALSTSIGSVGIAIVAVLAAPTPSAQATDGYFSSGYGIKNKGRGGAAQTATDDAFGGANNPATVSWEEDRLDFGVDWFRPNRKAERTGAGPLTGSVSSNHKNFFIPEIGYKRTINDHFAAGIAVYGNGGMNTDYQNGQINLGPGATEQNLLAGSGRLGVNLSQLFVTPTLSWKFADHQSVGIAPIIAYQQFEAHGLSAFGALSQNATALTDAGTDHSWGAGGRIGYLWKVSTKVSLGATYSSRVYSGGFDRYRGLFAGSGSFDVPQSVAAGIGWQVLPKVRLSADYKWIDNASISPVGNPSTNPGQLGQESGPGFGWRSISVVKLGVDYNLTESLTLRTGYGFSENPIRPSDVTFNILAPGVVQHHLTLGVSYRLRSHELSAAYVHAFQNSVSGDSRFVALGFAPPGARETISMSQDSVAIQYSWHFK